MGRRGATGLRPGMKGDESVGGEHDLDNLIFLADSYIRRKKSQVTPAAPVQPGHQAVSLGEEEAQRFGAHSSSS